MNTRLAKIQNWPALAREAQWSVCRLAKQCAVSPATLRRHFLFMAGKSPHRWLAEERQREAWALLLDGFTIKETAVCLGYGQQTNFTRSFKEHWGICPKTAQNSPVVRRPP